MCWQHMTTRTFPSVAGHTGPSADFILAIARGTPAFLLSLVDTGIFYSVRHTAIVSFCSFVLLPSLIDFQY